MNPTSECFKLIKKWEGLHRKRSDGLIEAYVDPGGIWTIGFGSIRHWDLDRPILETDVITEATAERWLNLEVEQVAEDVERLVKVPLTQGMFDALVSFVYNVGIGAFGESTILRKLNDHRDYNGASQEFDRWVHGTDNGVRKVLPGLVNRRNEEETMFRRDGLAPTGSSPITPTNPATISSTKEERAYKPAPVPLPFARSLQKGDVGDDCYILNCALAGLGMLRMSPQPNEFTQVTEDAVKLYQRREALSRIDGVVGPETKRAIENDLSAARPIDGLGVYCRLIRTDADAYEGLQWCKLQFIDPNKGVVESLDVVSGVPGAQRFLPWNHPDSVPGNLAPIPQDRYHIGDIDWAGGKDNYDQSHADLNDGIGPVWVPIMKLNNRPRNCSHSGCRDAFGFHADWNWIRTKSHAGSIGCVCPTTLDDLKKLVSLLRQYNPRWLIVDWGV